MLKIGVITLFPEILDCLRHSIPGRAVHMEKLCLRYWNPRNYTNDKHRTVDDKPYGGGPGMLMKVAPLRRALTAAKAELPQAKTVALSPRGQVFTQQTAVTWARAERPLILLAGRYEGIDERLLQHDLDEEWSIGDYVLSGGELAAAVMIDALARLLPGVLGSADSGLKDSFCAGLLGCPQYTRPKIIDGMEVPGVLLSGDHERIARWRLQQALGQTWLKRPDLLQSLDLSLEERRLLGEFKVAYAKGDTTTRDRERQTREE